MAWYRKRTFPQRITMQQVSQTYHTFQVSQIQVSSKSEEISNLTTTGWFCFLKWEFRGPEFPNYEEMTFFRAFRVISGSNGVISGYFLVKKSHSRSLRFQFLVLNIFLTFLQNHPVVDHTRRAQPTKPYNYPSNHLKKSHVFQLQTFIALFQQSDRNQRSSGM